MPRQHKAVEKSLADYAFEAGVRYRHLKDGEKTVDGELLQEYNSYHHGSKTGRKNRIAILDGGPGLLTLLDRWNKQTRTSGWTFYSA